MTWEAFVLKVRSYQRGFMGEPMEVRPGRGEFHENPSSCICEEPVAKSMKDSGNKKPGKKGDTVKEEPESVVNDQDADNELDWWEQEDEDQDGDLSGQSQLNETMLDYDSGNSDEPELYELLSD
ncbi:hypothetical protein SAY87_003122 [Trapa incisa]|uniref:Uncharacterized protein n=1 Tax=Trapa incisa TaxID=236973 RepID=A0AAN7KIS9_9MYRT|nr:hypothetical protein SAY87_003122 [Trapa incisa]